LTYLHGDGFDQRHARPRPETPMHLDAMFADEPLAAGSSRCWATSICAC
jgi:hypothetical protein